MTFSYTVNDSNIFKNDQAWSYLSHNPLFLFSPTQDFFSKCPLYLHVTFCVFLYHPLSLTDAVCICVHVSHVCMHVHVCVFVCVFVYMYICVYACEF